MFIKMDAGMKMIFKLPKTRRQGLRKNILVLAMILLTEDLGWSFFFFSSGGEEP